MGISKICTADKSCNFAVYTTDFPVKNKRINTQVVNSLTYPQFQFSWFQNKPCLIVFSLFLSLLCARNKSSDALALITRQWMIKWFSSYLKSFRHVLFVSFFWWGRCFSFLCYITSGQCINMGGKQCMYFILLWLLQWCVLSMVFIFWFEWNQCHQWHHDVNEIAFHCFLKCNPSPFQTAKN